ncbi:hypothetical protein FCM35_KLT00538 [Carex littledalei]|uniref:Disease resistance N-terminal domain-containing protein n=1 Tax=Carex littledalei TaxID=544730 RepID=A0A833R3F4_9POAL|nr:hypothetical protein FCM35_KLT00538 [Carex littledalei]
MGLGGAISNLLSLGNKLLPSVKASAGDQNHQIEAELERLMRMLERIKATLYDAEQREIRDLSVKLWLKELKRVASPIDRADKGEEVRSFENFYTEPMEQQQHALNKEGEGTSSIQDQTTLNGVEGRYMHLPTMDYVHNSMQDLEENIMQGSPIFEEGQVSNSQPRRSARLLSKNKGVYVNSLEKARITQGYANEDSTRKQSKKRKIKSSNLNNEEYMKTFNPLSIEHAEAVVFIAGVQISEELQKAIEEALKKDDHQGT